MPFITVVIPLYNKEDYIHRAISSVLRQSFKDFEVLIVDDGSIDNSLKIVNYIHDKRINVIKQKNAGPAAARNTGVRNAKGEWVIFLDADDEFLPNALSTFNNLIQKNSSIPYIICNYYLQMKNEKRLFTNIKTDKVLKHPFLLEYLEVLSGRPGSEIIRKDIMDKYPYNESLRRYEDAENQYRILRDVKVYQASIPVMISHRDASEAAGFRKDFSEDFLCSMEFKGKSFWEQMQLYKLSLEAYVGYGEKASKLYNTLYTCKKCRLIHRLYKKWKMCNDFQKQRITNFINFV